VIVAFTRSLAKQLAERGIRVNAVAPGPVSTPLQVVGGSWGAEGFYTEQMAASAPLNRMAQVR
jgi:NAD(P)-dependent dehydrogenase (short-subunit alcohol dehydrogenase family)